MARDMELIDRDNKTMLARSLLNVVDNRTTQAVSSSQKHAKPTSLPVQRPESTFIQSETSYHRCDFTSHAQL